MRVCVCNAQLVTHLYDMVCDQLLGWGNISKPCYLSMRTLKLPKGVQILQLNTIFYRLNTSFLHFLKTLLECLHSPFSQPLKLGRYGEIRMWRIPFFLVKLSNSSLVNGVPLSLTIVSGMLCVANIIHNFSIAAVDVAELTTCTSMYFECVSIHTRYIFPCNGPA
jgi:hypothetical protein